MGLEGTVTAAEQEELTKLKGKILKIPQVDKTLAKEGYAADAKTTGEAISKLKLSGTYTGNGSTDARTVEVGGSGNMIIVTSTGYTAFVVQTGALVANNNTAELSWVPGTEVSYLADLLLNTAHEAFNGTDTEYEYGVA